MVNSREKLLSPSAALNRFSPSEGAVTGIQPYERRQRTRYGMLIGDIGLLIDQATTCEIIEQTPIYPLPHMPHWQRGLINLRGNLVPVFDLKSLMELDQESSEKQWLLVLDRGEMAVGLFGDGLPRPVATTRPMDRLPPLPSVLRPHISQAFTFEGFVWLAFDHRSFFQSLATRISGFG